MARSWFFAVAVAGSCLLAGPTAGSAQGAHVLSQATAAAAKRAPKPNVTPSKKKVKAVHRAAKMAPTIRVTPVGQGGVPGHG